MKCSVVILRSVGLGSVNEALDFILSVFIFFLFLSVVLFICLALSVPLLLASSLTVFCFVPCHISFLLSFCHPGTLFLISFSGRVSFLCVSYVFPSLDFAKSNLAAAYRPIRAHGTTQLP
jgi:hypothetical protein